MTDGAPPGLNDRNALWMADRTNCMDLSPCIAQRCFAFLGLRCMLGLVRIDRPDSPARAFGRAIVWFARPRACLIELVYRVVRLD